jgi:flagellar hook-associated protein 1
VDAQGNSNGNALQLASLATSSNAVDGLSFGDFFSGVAAGVGRESSTAQDNQQTQEQVVAQVRSLRDQTSGVSLDEQAVLLLQFQRSYQATARLLTTLNNVADATINLIK